MMLFVTTWLTAWSALAPPDTQNVRTVDRVDLARYAGQWYENARFPNRFQRSCAGNVTARYAVRADGRMDVTNRCTGEDGRATTAQGVARVVDTRTNAKLKVRFAPALFSWLPQVWGDYPRARRPTAAVGSNVEHEQPYVRLRGGGQGQGCRESGRDKDLSLVMSAVLLC